MSESVGMASIQTIQLPANEKTKVVGNPVGLHLQIWFICENLEYSALSRYFWTDGTSDMFTLLIRVFLLL